jgi:hypothetical protein
MNFLLLIPGLTFLVLSVLLYVISNNENKNEMSVILTQNVLPSVVVSVMAFLIIKYRDNFNEPVMKGNYFD